MNPRALLALVLLATPVAHAEDVASTIHGGVGAAWREPSEDPPFDQVTLEYDTGTVLFVDVASHYRPGLLLRLSYSYTFYDELTALGLALQEDIEQHDGRAGLFYAPWPRGPLAWRIGGGYAHAHEDIDQPKNERSQVGGFVEAGLTLRAARRLTLDLAGAGLKWEGDGDYDAEGAELRLAAIVHTRPLDVVIGGRYLDLQREDRFDEALYELRVGIGGAWGYPEN